MSARLKKRAFFFAFLSDLNVLGMNLLILK